MNGKRKLPDGWKWVRLGDYVTKIGSGVTPRGGHAAYVASGIPLIRSQNVHLNRFVSDGIAYITAEQDASMANSRVQPGDVLLNITGASIGRVCVVPDEICPANVNQHVSIIRCCDDFIPEFVSYYISSPEFQAHIFTSEAGATRQALTKSLIESFKIPLATQAEQRRIVSSLHSCMKEMEKARAAAQKQLDEINALSTSLLCQAFSGKL